MANPDSRWSDDRIDGLAGDLDDLKADRHTLTELTREVGDVKAVAATLTELEKRAREDSVRRQRQIDARFDRLEEIVQEQFRKVHVDHAHSAQTLQQIKEPPRSAWDRFKDTMAWLGPIIVALIGAYVIVKTGQQTTGTP